MLYSQAVPRPALKFQEFISLAAYTTFRIGGPARFFCEVKEETEFAEAVSFAKQRNLPLFVLGGGSNLLVSDAGFDGVVLRVGVQSAFVVDPHVLFIGPNMAAARHLYDSFVGKDADAHWTPALAVSWRQIDPQTWRDLPGVDRVLGNENKLRPESWANRSGPP